MPKVKLMISRAGIGFAQNAGDVIECSEDDAMRLIRMGKAEPVSDRGVQKAMKKPRGRKAISDEG